MKKIISCVLLLSLALTIVVSAMPSQQNSSMMNNAQMVTSVGGSAWGCTLGFGAFGVLLIAQGMSGPIGWATLAYTISGAMAMAAGCS